MPLFVGSLLVSVIALAIAVPLGISAAIYVSEIAGPKEKNLVKPYIEFIAAIPSVVLGFFGIAVVGEAIRAASQSHWLSWVSFFPISERLNIFIVLGMLLGLGGGVFLVPLLTLALGVPIRGAVAASLVCVIATASASV